LGSYTFSVFSLVSCVAAVHGIRAAMQSLKKTGTDFTSAQGMDPKAFFEVMGRVPCNNLNADAQHFCQVSMMSLASTRVQAEVLSHLFKVNYH